jgi:stalled ribosome alternative rescue factor ArfA
LRINQSRLNSRNAIKEYKIKALLIEPIKRERKKKGDIGYKPKGVSKLIRVSNQESFIVNQKIGCF